MGLHKSFFRHISQPQRILAFIWVLPPHFLQSSMFAFNEIKIKDITENLETSIGSSPLLAELKLMRRSLNPNPGG
jgi:hypothetical protein